jgi:predicted lipid-binding transport protein (Tim44 family)
VPQGPGGTSAWATSGGSPNEARHWSDWREPAGAWEPNRLPDPLDGSPGPYESLEPQAAQQQPIPWIAWASLVWALFGGGIIIGLVLGIVARRRIKASNGLLGGLALANIAIALNLVTLIYILVVIVPSFWKAMQTW